MEYSNAENYLLNLYASLVKDKSYDKFKKIYDNIVILYTKEDTFIASNIIKTLNFYYAVSFNKTVNEDYIYNEFLNNEEEALELIINFYSKIIIKDKIMDLANDNLKELTYEVRSLNDFLRFTLMEVFSAILHSIQTDPFIELELFLNSDVETSNDIINEKINILRNYKPYLANIIYSDLFEHLSLCNDKEIVEIKNMIKYIILNRDNFETEVLLRKEILKLYVSLNMDNYKRKEARKKFSEEDFSLIRRINPLYKLDS